MLTKAQSFTIPNYADLTAKRWPGTPSAAPGLPIVVGHGLAEANSACGS